VELRSTGGIWSTVTGGGSDFNRLGTDGAIQTFWKDGTSVGSWQSRAGAVSTIILDPRTGGRGLSAGTDSIVPTDKDGALSNGATDIGEQNFKFRNAYLSGGVYLGGTGAANKLEDYETGSWTPVLTGTGYSFGTHTGRYVKVGNLVYITALFNVTTIGSNNSIIGWSGAPFTTEAVTALHQVGVVRESSTTGRLYQIQINAGSSGGSMNSMDGITGGSNEIFTTGSYAVSVTYKI